MFLNEGGISHLLLFMVAVFAFDWDESLIPLVIIIIEIKVLRMTQFFELREQLCIRFLDTLHLPFAIACLFKHLIFFLLVSRAQSFQF